MEDYDDEGLGLGGGGGSDDFEEHPSSSILGEILSTLSSMDRKPTQQAILQATRDILDHQQFDNNFPDPFTFTK
jgi:hypothetical protein